MADKHPCDKPTIPWDEQQGYNASEDGRVGCAKCGAPLRDHEDPWTRGEKEPLRERMLRIKQAATRRALTVLLTPAMARALANEIARDLFTNGRGQRASRLVLTGSQGEDMGGWCLSAVADRICAHLERGGRRG